MKLTLKELSEKLECDYIGDGSVEITGVAEISQSSRGTITLAVSNKYVSQLKNVSPSAVIVGNDVDAEITIPHIRHEYPYYILARALEIFYPKKKNEGIIHESAVVNSSAKIGKGVSIGACTVLGENVHIGDDSIIHSGVVIADNVSIGCQTEIYPKVAIRENCIVGDRVIIQSGAVIGSDGFGFTHVNGAHYKIPQIGNVVIGNDVEIGANVTVDRAAIGTTRIGNGTKIDNLVHIAHNVEIGEHCIIVAQVGVSGSVQIGNNVTLAGQVGVVGHLKIGDNTVVAARAVVTNDISPNSFVSGFPAKPHKEERRILAAMKKLPEIIKILKKQKCWKEVDKGTDECE